MKLIKTFSQLRMAVFIALTALHQIATAQDETRIEVDAGKAFNASKDGGDVGRLKRLALNVGTEFGTNRVTEAYLASLGVRTLRLINVGISGRFDDQGAFVEVKPSPRLESDLSMCQRLGANPHVIIHGLPEQLQEKVPLKVTKHRALGIDIENKRQSIGPTDYRLLENWYLAYFEYVKIQRGFKDAVFEIFNEPDLGTLIYPTDQIPPKGSAAAYDCMLKIYRAASNAAKQFEAKHAPLELKLGGVSSFAFTFKLGPQGSWAHKFVADCAREKLKLDFLSLHHYASIAPMRGEIRPELTNYPSFPDMLASVRAVIDRDMPGLPVWITEYGAHHNVGGKIGEINGSHDGAAFSLDCLDAMLSLGIDSAIYLVTSDQYRRGPNTQRSENIYSWCSFMTSPDAFGYPYPKAPFHAYKMVSELSGKRVATTVSGGKTRAFAAVAPDNRTLRVILWNYATYIPEFAPPIEEGKTETIKLSIGNAALPRDVKAVVRVVDKNHGDIFSAVRADRPANLEAATPLIVTPPIRSDGGKLEFELTMRPGSIAMLEIGANPTTPSLRVPYDEEAEILLKAMRDGRDQQRPETVLADGHKLLGIGAAHPSQKLDALNLMVAAAGKTGNVEEAKRLALKAVVLSKERGEPPAYAVARQLGDRARDEKDYTAMAEWYRQALAAPDCDWRSRFGTQLTLIDHLNSERKFAEVVEFCDAIIAGKDYDEHPELKGDFRLRKLSALRSLGKTDQMLAVYKELMASGGKSDVKLSAVIDVVTFHSYRKDFEKALAEGQVGLSLNGTSPGMQRKLKSVLDQIEALKRKDKEL